jgi:hypothetical protein
MRAEQPKRFLPGPSAAPYRYCGVSTGCDCQALKAELLAAGTTADDKILVGIQRILIAEDHRQRDEAETEEMRKKRLANRKKAERRWERKPYLAAVRVPEACRLN